MFGRGSWAEARRVAEVLRMETVGGILLLIAAVIALIWANTPWSDVYHELSAFRVGPAAWHLDLSLATWAADGLLAVFFFVAGLELKREFVAGDLREPRRAALPVAAAVGGMALPAVIFALIAARAGGDALAGWAIPTATDIAFALAVLGIISTHLPAALRTFLLTLAVVDDLLAITVIAVFYSSSLHLLSLLGALAAVAVFGFLVQRGITRWWLLFPLAVVAWVLVHESGIHATVAGVLLAFTVPVRSRDGGHGLAERLEHSWRPISSGFAVPVFAFFAAGVTVADAGGLGAGLTSTITMAIIVALVVGKAIGITGSTYLVQRFTRAQMAEGLSWWDVVGVALLGGIGFTVSLLIGELAYGVGSAGDGYAKIGVLAGSLLSALLAAAVLRVRNRHYRKLHERETADVDNDGIPDVYQDRPS
ncbi:Na+/H+ antiporter NhaA [Paractinoplanes ovalisporus]|nr:Na+/H+ antiporter NhaA [Actinoplanes ovalisporus]